MWERNPLTIGIKRIPAGTHDVRRRGVVEARRIKAERRQHLVLDEALDGLAHRPGDRETGERVPEVGILIGGSRQVAVAQAAADLGEQILFGRVDERVNP